MQPDFQQRSGQTELMDDPSIGYADFSACLHDLAVVNHLTFAYRPTLRWLAKVTCDLPRSQTISILDIGCGGGDMLRKIASWATAQQSKVKLTGVDLNPWSKQYAERLPSTLPIAYITKNIFELAEAERPDFIISSLFTHHLTDEQLIRLLRWMDNFARRGWFINDLHRHKIAYFLFRHITPLLRFHHMVPHDGAISITRAFVPQDWRDLLLSADIPAKQAKVERMFPFRLCVARQQP